jgi:hypothetical protein
LSGSVPAENSGVRFLWYGGKAAIRAGGIDGTQWDDANIGLYSTAFGENVRALGDNALAIGKSCVAAGSRTTAIGEGCTATGYASVALGYGASPPPPALRVSVRSSFPTSRCRSPTPSAPTSTAARSSTPR